MISGCGLEVGSGGIGPSRKRRSLARMSQLGHEERFPPTRLSAGCGFRKETIAGMRRNGRDAPKAATPVLPIGRGIKPPALCAVRRLTSKPIPRPAARPIWPTTTACFTPMGCWRKRTRLPARCRISRRCGANAANSGGSGEFGPRASGEGRLTELTAGAQRGR
jgi:hypothetical protein